MAAAKTWGAWDLRCTFLWGQEEQSDSDGKSSTEDKYNNKLFSLIGVTIDDVFADLSKNISLVILSHMNRKSAKVFMQNLDICVPMAHRKGKFLSSYFSWC